MRRQVRADIRNESPVECDLSDGYQLKVQVLIELLQLAIEDFSIEFEAI